MHKLRGVLAKNSYAVPTLLSVYKGLVAKLFEVIYREYVIGSFQFLETNNIRLSIF
jgi:hypothetical protein